MVSYDDLIKFCEGGFTMAMSINDYRMNDIGVDVPEVSVQVALNASN